MKGPRSHTEPWANYAQTTFPPNDPQPKDHYM